jgi:hypothetical protein
MLIGIMTGLVGLTYPKRLIEAARLHREGGGGHDHGDMTAPGGTLWAKLTGRQGPVMIAQNSAMDWGMLWKDLALGFVITGAPVSMRARRCLAKPVRRPRLTHTSGTGQRADRSAGGRDLLRLLNRQRADGGGAVRRRDQLRRGAGFLLCRPDRAATSRCLSPLLRAEDGGLYRPRCSTQR